MRLHRRLAIAGALTLLVGLAGPPTAGAAPPAPRETIKATVKKLRKALGSGKCQPLGRVLRHSSQRTDPNDPAKVVKPSAKFTPAECDAIEQFASQLDGFRPAKSQELGTGAVVQGTKDGTPLAVVFALDVDRRWRAVGGGPFAPQVGTTSTADYQGAVTSWVEAIKSANCQESWRLFTVDSPYVTSRASTGGVTDWCTDVQAAAQRGSGRVADLVAATAPPQPLGALQDVAFYGVDTESGGYLTIILFTEPGAEDEHANPGVFEFVTSRRPRS